MGTNSPGGHQRCRLILKQCLAIQLIKYGHAPDDFWMYDSGYMIFQNFLAANAQCWWNTPLTAATRTLKYAGHIAPGILLVTGEPCALEIVRGAYARSVLKPPATYHISSVGDIEDCIVSPIVQGQFTPLPEALCDVIMDLTAEGCSATNENIRMKLEVRFPHMTSPSMEVVYDTLAQLMQEQKIYQTAKGYFILTPERRRSRSRPRNHRNGCTNVDESVASNPQETRIMLLTNAEALHSLYGEISTERDGDLTHQCIQTNLADIICGGNPNDKILYPRTTKRRSSSFPTPRSLERRHSMRLFGSSKRLQRCSSTRSLSKAYAQVLNTDSSSSEYQSTDSSSPKKGSLLSRLFRRSGRNKVRQLEAYSAQFPPAEWFNSKAVHLHSVSTQTAEPDMPTIHTLSNSTFYDGSELSQRSLTLPRRHRQPSESTFFISSRDCSPIRRRSPVYSSSSLPRSTQSIPATANSTNSTNSFSKPNNTNSHLGSPYRSSNTQHYSRLAATTVARNAIDSNQYQAGIKTHKMHSIQYQDSNRCDERSLLSGPSSLDSLKTSTLTSGPSSIDSSKTSYHRANGHSSLDSQRSNSSTTTKPDRAHSILTLNGSPRAKSRYQTVRHLNINTNVMTSNPKKTMASHAVTGIPAINNSNIPISSVATTTTTVEQSTSSSSSYNCDTMNNSKNNENISSISSSTSNNSITLKVTTSNDRNSTLPNTRIVVQNSPAQSVITFKNSQLNENANVFIFNNETTTNENGQIISKTLSKHQPLYKSKYQQQQQQQQKSTPTTTTAAATTTVTASSLSSSSSVITEPNESLFCASNNTVQEGRTARGFPTAKDNYFRDHQNECNLETFGAGNNPSNKSKSNRLQLTSPTAQSLAAIAGSNDNCNSPNCNTLGSSNTMNNSYDKQMAATANAANAANAANVATATDVRFLYKNNIFKSNETPCITLDTEEKQQSSPWSNGNDSFELSSSLGNLRYFEKHSKDTMAKSLNSNCDLNNVKYELANHNCCRPTPNGNNLANILQKNNIAIGSEPNLSLKDNNCAAISDQKIAKKENLNRRFSIAKDPTTDADDLFNFPSLTDLSFNFTSLAAQKILQGVSLNSIDTLVELNMAAAAAAAAASVAATNGPVSIEKPQNQTNTAVCRDYGLV